MYKQQFTYACHYRDTLPIPAIFGSAELPPPAGVAVGLREGVEATSPPATDEVEELTMTGEGERLVMTDEVEGSGSGWASTSVQ